MSIALCHEWVTTFGGSEQVSARLASALGVRDVFTFAANPALARELFPDARVRVHPVGTRSLARRHWQWFLPMMPFAWRNLDLGAYDVVLTSSHAATNSIRVRPGARHISYCHTPMRYAWDWRSEARRFPTPLRPLLPAAAGALRRLDRGAAQRVTTFVANSENVRARIRRHYGRASIVVHPPIDTSYWTPGDSPTRDFFLYAGRLVPYKRPEVAIEAARLTGRPLVVAGSGPDLPRLRRDAPPNVRFVPDPTTDRLRELYRDATALVFPGIEDFGMTMVESQSCGTPVIALDAGGAREAVGRDAPGLLYGEPTAEGLARAMWAFEPDRYPVEALRRHASRFDASRFDAAMRMVLDAVMHASVRVAASDEFAQRTQKDLEIERE